MKHTTWVSMVTLITLLFLVGCASTTTINSVPSSAEIWIDGMKVGNTPYTHTDEDMSFSTKTVQLKKAGYQDFTNVIKRDKMNTQNFIISFLCFWPGFLWSWDYPPTYTFSMVKNTADLYEMSYEYAPEFVAGN